jgi:DNA replication and repair protein RecF
MFIHSLGLSDFRSYRKRKITFPHPVTVIIGPNGSGKTNLLEALSVASTGKSFRADTDREMVRWDSELARVTVELTDLKLELLITVGTVGGRHVPSKKYIVNGISRRAVDFVGNVKTVLFWPEDLELVTDSPSTRRKYLDRVIVQVDREYRRNLYSYERGIRQRNKLLDRIKEGEASRSQLMFWDQLLIKSGSYLTDIRSQFISYINDKKDDILRYRIEYDKSVISEARLVQYAREEVAARATLVGPHRDDFHLLISTDDDGLGSEMRSLTAYGSRGEQRLGVLWLKLAELSYIEKFTGDKPMLLLDDIFSELDEENKARILRLVGNQQTVITSADPGITELFSGSGIEFDMIHLAGK